MPNSSSINLTSLDFDSYKSSLKSYLREQDRFKDYDFEGSNMSVLLDLLSYNTYLNAYYLQMVGNEMFLDTAQLRDSVISHSKELNYLPRSFSSAYAKINVRIESTDPTKRSVVMPKGTSFLSRVGDDTFSFATDQNMVASSSDNIFSFEDVLIYEGRYLSDSYIIDYSQENPRFVINNKNVDLSSVSVVVIEDNGSNRIQYSRAISLLDLDSDSSVFFIQPSSNDTYEIAFGDGVIGRRPKNNSVVVIEYRTCSGELPNGAQNFITSGRIDSESEILVTTVNPANFGAVAESLDSIKRNAPRAFTTQERAVTAEDYENLLKINFPEINAVSAFGGEDANPPQYGRVFISVDINDVDSFPASKKEEYTRFIKSRASVSMEPIFISPEYTCLGIRSSIKYNINQTGLNPEDIRTLAISSMLDYSNESLNNFNRTLRYSRFIQTIDDSDSSIISNDTDISLIKTVSPIINSPQKIFVNFKARLFNSSFITEDEHPIETNHTITSSLFSYGTQEGCLIEDDGAGILRVVVPQGNVHKTLINVGTIDYETGELNINDLVISNFVGNRLKFYAIPRDKDIIGNQSTILKIIESDINISVERQRE